MSCRTIMLRRPPTLQIVDEPFLPKDVSIDEIDARWATLCADNPAYFDGPAYHVIGVHRNGAGGVVLHVVATSYRFYAVQNGSYDIGVRGLGVRGVCYRGNEVLLGRRAENVAQYGGQWEFLPAGTLEPGYDPATMLLRELDEETGLTTTRPPIPVAVLYDHIARAWQLLYHITIADNRRPATDCSGEHDDMCWRRLDNLPEPLSLVDQLTLAVFK